MADVAPRRYNTRSRSKSVAPEDEAPAPVAPARTRRTAASATASTGPVRKKATTAASAGTTRTARKTTVSTTAERASTKRAASSDAPRRSVKRITPSPEVEVVVEIPVPKRTSRGRATSTTKRSPKAARTKKKVTFHSPSMREINKENNGPNAPTDSLPKKSILTNSSVNVLPPPSPPKKRATTPKLDPEDDDDLNNFEPILNSPHRRARSEPLFGANINLSPVRAAPPVRPVSPVRLTQSLSSIPTLGPLSSSQTLTLRSPIRPPVRPTVQPSLPILEDESDNDLSSSRSMPIRPPQGTIISSPRKVSQRPAEERERVRNTPARRPPPTPAKMSNVSSTPLFGRSTPAAPVSVRATPARRPAIPQGFATNLVQKKEKELPAGSLSVNGPVRMKLPMPKHDNKIPKLDLSSFAADSMFNPPKTPTRTPLFSHKEKSTSKIPVKSPVIEAPEEDVNADESLMENDENSEPGTPTPATRLFVSSPTPSKIPTPVSSPKASPRILPVQYPKEPKAEEVKPTEPIPEQSISQDAEDEATQSTEPETDADGDSQMMDSPDQSFEGPPVVSPTPAPKSAVPATDTPRGYGLRDVDVEDSMNETISTLRDSGAYLLAPITGQLEDFHLSLGISSPVRSADAENIIDENTPRPAQSSFRTPPRNTFSPNIPIDPALLAEADRVEQEEENYGPMTVPVKFSPSPNTSFSSDQENKIPNSPESIADGIVPKVEMSRGRSPRRARQSVTGILAGAVVFVDVHTTEGENVSASFVDMLIKMGAKVVKRWDWNPAERTKVGITHVVFKDGSPRTLEKCRAAPIVQCVGINWVADCSREQYWLDEADYAVDTDCIPRGGQRRRKSMEPKMYYAQNQTPAPAPVKAPSTIAHPSTNLFNNILPLELANANNMSEQSMQTPPEAPEPPCDEEDTSFFIDPAITSTPVQVSLTPATPERTSTVQFSIPMTCPQPKKMDESGMSDVIRERLNLARRKSLQFRPKIGSPLARKSWTAFD